MEGALHRHYRLEGLNFRDFWDICSHYQKLHPRYRRILYTVEGFGPEICADKEDVAEVLQAVSNTREPVRAYVARYYLSTSSEPGDYGNAKMVFLPESSDFSTAGLHLYSFQEDKLLVYKFEQHILDGYAPSEDQEVELEYGVPCEVLCAVIDMRGFSRFCEQPHVESPYTCGLLTAFYNMVKHGFRRYPPDLVKFLGDGVLAVWQTFSADRTVAIDTCLEGLARMPSAWQAIVAGPEFSHGAPEGIGSGVSFGLASKITIDNDYIGRPINIAHRLCGTCPAYRTYIDHTVPGIDQTRVKRAVVRLKTYGDQRVWLLDNS